MLDVVSAKSNVNKPGKWLFRLDRATIQTTGCASADDSFTNAAQTVQQRGKSIHRLCISPPFVYSIERQNIELVGASIDLNNVANARSRAVCRFGETMNNAVESEALPVTPSTNPSKLGNVPVRFICQTPMFYRTGQRIDELKSILCLCFST